MTQKFRSFLLKQLKAKNSYQAIKTILERTEVTHATRVKFALLVATSVLHLVDTKDKKAVQNCLGLVESWLINSNNVSNEQLRDAAHAIDFFSSAANAASNAANAITVTITNTAAYAATAADNAADYAVNGRQAQLKKYLILLIKLLLENNKNIELIEVLYA